MESRRFAKIAKALGNRTPQQVASRVQKYFKKLHDAGMPIPGRIPKKTRGTTTKSKHYYRPTTFFPAHHVPVHMPEDDFQSELHNLHSPCLENAATSYTNDGVETDLEHYQNPEIRQRLLVMLKEIRTEKLNNPNGYNPDPLAPKCEQCELNAVSSLRWRCNTCYCLINLCSDCLVSELVTHKFEHISHDVVKESNEI